MGFIKDTVENITGKTGVEASKKGGKRLRESAARGIEGVRASQAGELAAIRGGAESATGRLDPFAQAGIGQLGASARGIDTVQSDLDQIRGLVTDPNQQKSFVQDNPFFGALADEAQRRTFGNAAAKGKTGSGGTAEALQNSILLLGNELVGQNVNQRQDIVSQGRGINQQRLSLVGTGAQAAGAQAGIDESTGVRTGNVIGGNARTIADLDLRGAGAAAAGDIAAANASTQATQNLINTGLGIGAIAVSDENEKENKTYVADVDGVPYYLFNYKGKKDPKFGTMAQKVEHIPGAVINVSGKKYVNYARL